MIWEFYEIRWRTQIVSSSAFIKIVDVELNNTLKIDSSISLVVDLGKLLIGFLMFVVKCVLFQNCFGKSLLKL